MSVHQWIYKLRGKLASVPLLISLVCFRWETEGDLVWIIGGACFFLGLSFRVWAQEHLHYRLKASMSLTMTGPYAFVRNPIYIGNTLICLSATCFSEILWLAPFTLLWCAGLYSLVVRYEEQHLSRQYGLPYGDYLLRVPRWFPRLSFRKTGSCKLHLINKHFFASLIAEVGCPLILLPFILKEVLFRP